MDSKLSDTITGADSSLAHWPYRSRVDEALDEATLAQITEQLTEPGEYLAFVEDGHERVVRLTREWTRIGRSLTADLRLDDMTVSRRHALIGRQPEKVRLLDDRSLNGVFVNREPVESTFLEDGDEIEIGRYRLSYLALAPNLESSGSPDALRC